MLCTMPLQNGSVLYLTPPFLSLFVFVLSCLSLSLYHRHHHYHVDYFQFATDYWFQFMSLLQGRIPVRINLFLLVNPPAWFGSVWKIMKPMLSHDFCERVHMIPESHLPAYLSHGYAKYLPDEMESGHAPTAALVNDYISYRQYVECAQGVYEPPKHRQTKQRAESRKSVQSAGMRGKLEKSMSIGSIMMQSKGCGAPHKFVE
jgi:hypothetical protein